MTADLFGQALLPGLDYQPDFVGSAEEWELVRELDAMDLSPFRFHGWTGKRKTHTFGWRYDFDDASFAPAEPFPDWLQPLRAKAAAFAGLDPGEIVHALLARYDPGAGIGWHRAGRCSTRSLGCRSERPPCCASASAPKPASKG